MDNTPPAAPEGRHDNQRDHDMVGEEAKFSAEAQVWQAHIEAARNAWVQGEQQQAYNHFADLMSQSEGWLLFLARQQVPPHLFSEAEDAVGQTYFNLWQRVERGDPVIHVKGLLRRILQRRVADLKRSGASLKAQELVSDDFWEAYDEATPGSEASPEQQAEEQEAEQLVNDLLDRLPPLERAVFVARRFDRQSVAATAEQLHLTEDQVKKRCQAAIRQLRQYLEQQDELL